MLPGPVFLSKQLWRAILNDRHNTGSLKSISSPVCFLNQYPKTWIAWLHHITETRELPYSLFHQVQDFWTTHKYSSVNLAATRRIWMPWIVTTYASWSPHPGSKSANAIPRSSASSWLNFHSGNSPLGRYGELCHSRLASWPVSSINVVVVAKRTNWLPNLLHKKPREHRLDHCRQSFSGSSSRR